ncbi:hypothetical protein ACSLOT_27075, partial [Escherichia coli]|uniref:hypothetical protein n=1 Tax=Escherichia coli TaxID=562 RepID=UPI003EE0763B
YKRLSPPAKFLTIFAQRGLKPPLSENGQEFCNYEKNTKRRGHATTIYNSTYFPVVFLSISMTFPKFDTLY